MMRDFSQCLQATLAAEQAPAEPAPATAPAAAAEAPVSPGEEADAAVASAGGAAAEAVGRRSAPARGPGAAVVRRGRSRSPQAAKPVHGIRLVLSVLWERIVRFFKRLFGRGEK